MVDIRGGKENMATHYDLKFSIREYGPDGNTRIREVNVECWKDFLKLDLQGEGLRPHEIPALQKILEGMNALQQGARG